MAVIHRRRCRLPPRRISMKVENQQNYPVAGGGYCVERLSPRHSVGNVGNGLATIGYEPFSADLTLGKRGCPQANRVALTGCCRGNNSFGDDFTHQLRLAGLVKHFAGSLESFAHRRDGFRFEYSGHHEWTNWHGDYLSRWRLF